MNAEPKPLRGNTDKRLGYLLETPAPGLALVFNA